MTEDSTRSEASDSMVDDPMIDWGPIVAGCQTRDPAAFARLIEHAHPRLERTLYRLGALTHDVDELLQETYLRAWSGIEGFRSASSPLTWLTRIAVNLTINRHRDRRSEQPLDPAIHEPSARPAADQRVLEREFQLALANLSEELRGPLLLRESHDLTYQQIADSLGCPIGTVMSRLHRARQSLLATLQDRLEELQP